MTIIEIQRAVEELVPEERQRLTAWMVSKYPILDVEQLMRHAAELIEKGEWTPSEPNEVDLPDAKVAAHARQVAERLDLER